MERILFPFIHRICTLNVTKIPECEARNHGPRGNFYVRLWMDGKGILRSEQHAKDAQIIWFCPKMLPRLE